jgi:hypothetical protein
VNCHGPIGSPGTTVLTTRRDFVIKCLGLPEVLERNHFCEAFGNLIARELGIRTPKPALILFDEDSAKRMTVQLRTEGVLTSAAHAIQPGLGVGTEYFKGGFVGIDQDFRVRKDEVLHQAIRIAAFDWLVQNPDRKAGHNPNCSILNDQLWAYDFELCFSFLLALAVGPQEPPYNILKHNPCSEHVFYRALSGRQCNWTPFLDALAALTDARLHMLTAGLPSNWQASALRVIAHLGQVRDHRKEFEIELHRSVA